MSYTVLQLYVLYSCGDVYLCFDIYVLQVCNICNTIPARFLSSSYDKFLQFVTEFVSLIAVKKPSQPSKYQATI